MIEKYVNRTEFSSYDDLIQNFRLNIPDNFNFAYDIVDEWAKTEPEKKALIWVDDNGNEKILTFGKIKEYSDRFANVLKEQGIGKGDIVALILKRRWEFWPAVVACFKIGAVALPINHLMMKKDLVYRFNSVNIKALVACDREEFLVEMEKAIPECNNLKTKIIAGKREGWLSFDNLVENASSYWERPYINDNNDIMLMYYTSGTTGFPKVVSHDYTYPLAHIVTALYMHDNKENEIDFTIADTGWAKAAYGKLYGQWICGTCVLVYDYNRFNVDSVLKTVEKYQVSSFCAPPTVYRYFLKEDLSGYDCSCVRYATSMGEPLYPEVYKDFLEYTGIEIHESFGQTESSLVLGNLIGLKIKPGYMGKAAPLYNLVILDENNKPAPVGKEGRIAVDLGRIVSDDPDVLPKQRFSDYPCGLFCGYIFDKEKNSKIYADHYYLTGDIGVMDADGYFRFVSRDDDVIKTSGYRVGPFEIESVLAEHPAVYECAVIGVPDFARGQIVKAIIVLSNGFEGTDELKEELKEFVKKNTAPYKYPRVIEFVNELPKTFSGKIKRSAIKR